MLTGLSHSSPRPTWKILPVVKQHCLHAGVPHEASTGAESEDDDAVLERMFNMHHKKKKLSKDDLPGLYKRRPAERSVPIQTRDDKHTKEDGGLGRGGLKKRASLPGRLRKKLAQQRSV